MKQMTLPNRIEADTHKYVLDQRDQRDRRKQKGKSKHDSKKKQNVKWYDHWD